MKIKSIHIYSTNKKRRDLKFNVNGLNIITGKSSTGKSAIYAIVEYCMGRDSYTVPIGVITDNVVWYAVTYQINDEQLFIARRAPEPGEQSSSQMVLRQGTTLLTPEYNELVTNIDRLSVVSKLSKLLGIPDNRTDVPLHQSRNSYRTTILHTTHYLFQEQNIIANREQLFYRQNEPFMLQTILDTFPILFKISSGERYVQAQELRELKRSLKLKNKELLAQTGDEHPQYNLAQKLLLEAQKVGMIGDKVDISASFSELIEYLQRALSWRPDTATMYGGKGEDGLNEVILALRSKRREIQHKIEAAGFYYNQSVGFKEEIIEQQSRLKSIKALPKNINNEWQWPFCEKNLGMDSSIAEVLLKELSTLDKELEFVSSENLQLEAYTAQLRDELQGITKQINEKENELSIVIAENESLALLRDMNYVASKILGRISYFLENIKTDDELYWLKNDITQLESKIDMLESEIGEDAFDDKLASTLNIISSKISKYINEFDVEYSEIPVRFDLKNLTLIFDRPNGAIAMNRTGSGQNHLAMHISTMLALHSYATKNNCPIPSFLFLDQPSQVYFPSQAVYKKIDGSINGTRGSKDIDLAKVTKLFELLLRYTQEDNPGFQLIVTEHANLSDTWFQKHLCEQPWSGSLALIPSDWIDNIKVTRTEMVYA